MYISALVIGTKNKVVVDFDFLERLAFEEGGPHIIN